MDIRKLLPALVAHCCWVLARLAKPNSTTDSEPVGAAKLTKPQCPVLPVSTTSQ
jgi:hypothetical protein